MYSASIHTISPPRNENIQHHSQESQPAAHWPSHILLAEDNDDLRILAQAFLESTGHHVIICSDGTQALAMLRSSMAFDLLVSDIEMPGATGIEVARVAAILRPSLPIILTSGAILPDAIHAQINAAGWTFVSKPSPMDKMHTAILNALHAGGSSDPKASF